MSALGMFPLGSVLFPHMPLRLNVFEERYLRLVADCVDRAAEGGGELGVVLIERGHEVGGGDERFDTGTRARILEVARHPDGRLAVSAIGTGRLRVRSWLGDDPYPQADVDPLEDIEVAGSAGLAALARADLAVRRCLRLKAELDEPTWPATIELDADPTVSAWQLAAVAPLGPLDHLVLLRSATSEDLLDRLAALAADEAAVLAFRRGSR